MKLKSLFLLLVLAALLIIGAACQLPGWASRIYGPPAASLSCGQRVKYSALVLWHDGLLTQPVGGEGQIDFYVPAGQTASQIALNLERAGLIRDARAFLDYLIYAGLDSSIQAGNYSLSPAESALALANRLQDATPAQITFVMLPGWRLEEVAAALPSSGFNISPDDFLQTARGFSGAYDFLPAAAGAEGFLLPDTYLLPRTLSAEALVNALVQNFALHLTQDLRAGFARQGLTVYQAVTLASIIQRESVLTEEMPIIASVFYNRLQNGMNLESDPTVQYAIGYDAARGGWWPVPLTRDDLQRDSAYNTYLYPGLPPGPIANPSLEALRAVAFPAQTPYFYFRAACDGSGRHRFAHTYQEHIQNACP